MGNFCVFLRYFGLTIDNNLSFQFIISKTNRNQWTVLKQSKDKEEKRCVWVAATAKVVQADWSLGLEIFEFVGFAEPSF